MREVVCEMPGCSNTDWEATCALCGRKLCMWHSVYFKGPLYCPDCEPEAIAEHNRMLDEAEAAEASDA